MAFRRTLSRRFFNAASSIAALPEGPSILRRLRRSSAEVDRGLLRRNPIFQPTVAPPVAGQLIDRIRGLEGLFPPLVSAAEKEEEEEEEEGVRVTVEEARKVIRASLMDMARERLRMMPRSRVSYSEFVTICGEVGGGGGGWLPRALDESGSVIVLRDVVFLRPELVARAVESMLTVPPTLTMDDQQHGALREMEEKKAEIDTKAERQVKRELWCGLGFLALQTAGFMRLTFWELSWDVMEPICFFVTSIYFMAGYGFFLRTSRDPSFEGFFHSRFATKQKRLMKAHDFDLNKFHDLKKAYSSSPPSLQGFSSGSSSNSDHGHHKNTFLGVVH